MLVDLTCDLEILINIDIDVDIVTDIGGEQHRDVYRPRSARTAIPSKTSRLQTPYVLDRGRERRVARDKDPTDRAIPRIPSKRIGWSQRVFRRTTEGITSRLYPTIQRF